MRDLAIGRMRNSQNVTFEEVEFRPCQTTSDSLSNHNWWMDAQGETSETGTETSTAVVLERPKGTDPKTGPSVRVKKNVLARKDI